MFTKLVALFLKVVQTVRGGALLKEASHYVTVMQCGQQFPTPATVLPHPDVLHQNVSSVV